MFLICQIDTTTILYMESIINAQLSRSKFQIKRPLSKLCDSFSLLGCVTLYVNSLLLCKYGVGFNRQSYVNQNLSSTVAAVQLEKRAREILDGNAKWDAQIKIINM
jgi:hypothetical protein